MLLRFLQCNVYTILLNNTTQLVVNRMRGAMKVPKAVREWLSKIGTKGGSRTSPAKAAAVRENGKLGGRPPGKKSETTREVSTDTKRGRNKGRH